MKKTKIAQLLQPQMTTKRKAPEMVVMIQLAKRKTQLTSAYHNLQTCLSDVGGEGSPTEQEVQDCMELSYSGIDSNESKPTESTDEDENGVNEDASTDDTEDEDSEE